MFKRRTQRKRPARKQKRSGNKTRINRSKIGLMPSVQNRNYATITESQRDTNLLTANLAVQEQFNIKAFPRAVALARFFKYYRCKQIVYDYDPLSNTFQDEVAGVSPTIPYMYYNMNRDGSSNGDQNLADFLAAGARPIKFTKKIVIAYKPNLSQLINAVDNGSPGNLNVYSLGSTPIYDKWLSTDGLQDVDGIGLTEPVENAVLPNPLVITQSVPQPPYYGHNVFFVQDETGAATTVARKSITVIWEFKEPVRLTVS